MAVHNCISPAHLEKLATQGPKGIIGLELGSSYSLEGSWAFQLAKTPIIFYYGPKIKAESCRTEK